MRYLNAKIPAAGEDRRVYSTVDSTASAGQTIFNVSYDQGRVAVFLNGIRLVPVQDYTYTLSGIGSNITLASGIVANDYLELIGYQGIYTGNALTEDIFVVGTASTGSGGGYTNSTTVFPVSSSTGDLVSVWRNGIKLVPTTDFTVNASASTVTLQSASNTADEITVHVIGILQHSNFVPVTGGTFTGTVAHTGTLNVSGGTLTTSTAQKTAIVDGGKGNLTKSDVGLGNVTNDAQVPASGGTFSGNVAVNGDLTVDTDTLKVDSSGNKVGIGTNATDKLQVKGAISSEATNSTNRWMTYTHTDNTYRVNYNGAGNDEVVIDSSGNVGIGSASPSTPLHIYKTGLADASTTALLTIDGKFVSDTIDSSDATGIAFRLENALGGSQTTTCIASSYQASYNALVLQPAGGNVGIGTTSPLAELQVVGDIHVGTDTGNRRAKLIYTNAGYDSTSYLGIAGKGNGAVGLTIRGDGEVTVVDGNLVIGTAGHGINFSADGENTVRYTTSNFG